MTHLGIKELSRQYAAKEPEHRAELAELTGKYERAHRLTNRQWSRFDFLQRKYAPEAYDARKAESRRQLLMKDARKLSIEDLKLIIAEKEVNGVP